MKRSWSIFVMLTFTAISMNAQQQYEVSVAEKHNNQKVLRGIVTKDILKNDTSFKWYEPNQSYYKPDTAIVNSLRKNKDKVQYVIFGGTWCEDTQFILPKFFKLQETADITDDQVTFFAVNENKKSLGHIAEAFGITNVPTIIVMKDSKEIGRVVEYGKNGKWDVELAEILNK